MKCFYKDGDKSKAICDSCQEIVETTIERVEVTDTKFNIVQDNLLVAKCDICGDIVAIPQQPMHSVKGVKIEG